MKSPIPINLVVEDALSEAVVQRLLTESPSRFAVGPSYGNSGYGYIKKMVNAFNNAAKGTPYLVLVDLEDECPPKQIQKWLQMPANPNLLFRVAVMEVESWLLADRLGFASFLNIRAELIPEDVDVITDPKNYLINLAKKSRKRAIREAIVPIPDSTARVGPDYNGQLSLYVLDVWNIQEAIKHSDSLRRAVNAINSFQPMWPS